MSETFIQRLTMAALQITKAERALAVDTHGQVLQAFNIETADLESPDFTGLTAVHEALNGNKLVLTTNIFIDPKAAPTTNTTYANLRTVVVIPLQGHGAVYLDQRVRNGIIVKTAVDKLIRLAEGRIAAGQLSETPEELVSAFKTLA